MKTSTVRRRTAGIGRVRVVVNLFLIGACVLAVYPFLVMLFGSFKTSGEISANPGGLPLTPTLDNFQQLLTGATGEVVWRGLFNSAVIAVPFTIITVLFAAMAGYAFAQYEFRGKRLIFAMLIASLLVPIEVNLPSLYVMFAKIEWLNTYQVQILPGTASVISMFMARQFMEGLPKDVLEAARVDGAGHWRTFVQVALPMSAPVLGAIAVLTFVAKWSDYLWPRIMTSDPTVQPFMVLLPALSTGSSGFIVQIQTLLAGSVLVVVPLLIVFVVFQDKLMNGATAGAVRE